MILTINSTDPINWGASGTEQIKNNVINILRTRTGEVPYLRNMGISADYIDKPISDMKAALINSVINNIQTYEPRATVQSVEIGNVDEEQLIIEVVIEI